MMENVVLNAKILGAKAVIGVQRAVAGAKIDLNEMLSGDGAAGDKGALAEVKKQVDEYGKGGFSIVQSAVVYIVAIALLIGAGAIAFYSGNANKREEAKTAFGWRFAAGILAFAGISILAFAQTIGTALFGNSVAG